LSTGPPSSILTLLAIASDTHFFNPARNSFSLDNPAHASTLARFDLSIMVELQVLSTAFAILDRPGNGIFGQFFTQSCFNAPFIKLPLQPACWCVEDNYDPLDTDTSTSFHVYQFITCLRSHSAHPALLPSTGFTCLEMKPLAHFIFTWFRSMDINPSFETAKFDQSILGSRLRFLTGGIF
jgi:hypothetical protein